MELFKNIRLKAGETILRRKIAGSKRKVHYSSFGQVKKIGIVWDASNTKEFHYLSRFYQEMHDRNIEVKIIGYFDGKNLPDQYTAIRYLACIRRHELNFFYQPVTNEANSFINGHFDIVIDINFRKLFPLRWITSLSNSGFKVGLTEQENIHSPFDLMLELKNPVDIDDYLHQILKYLEMINSSEQVKMQINN
jgi:hypothetical protein